MPDPTDLVVGELTYLYVGTNDVERDLAFCERALGAARLALTDRTLKPRRRGGG